MDSFKLKFNDGQSVSIHRPEFDKNAVAYFVKMAIEKSEFPVAIADDAKSKIYSSKKNSRIKNDSLNAQLPSCQIKTIP